MKNIENYRENYYTERMNITKHCNIRCQQRGISHSVAAFIVKYGNYVRTHNDKKYFINKKKLKNLFHQHKLFILKNDKEILSTAVVANGRNIITTMKINKKINWN